MTRAGLTAFENVSRFIKSETVLPGRVLGQEWLITRFFEADTVVSKIFISAVHKLMEIERSTSCCLLNITKSPVIEYHNASFLFLETRTTDEEYIAKLREGGPALGWIFWMDRYGCASDKGEWCVYCERNNDVAFISFRDADVAKRYHRPIEVLRAEPIEALIKTPALQVVPFNHLTTEWKNGLTQNYGSFPITLVKS
jgi:hypothetical protein